MNPPDYGADPLGNGQFRMVPSGDVVDRAERDRRMEAARKARTNPAPRNEILGLSWTELERRQGGKLTR